MNVRGPLPVEVTAVLLRAMHALERARPPWPVLDEEGWWRDVLHDPRARRPSEKRLDANGRWAYLRLDRFRRPRMTLACARCGLREEFDTDDVRRSFGDDYNIGLLRHKLVRCPHRKLRDAVFEHCPLDYDTRA